MRRLIIAGSAALALLGVVPAGASAARQPTSAERATLMRLGTKEITGVAGKVTLRYPLVSTVGPYARLRIVPKPRYRDRVQSETLLFKRIHAQWRFVGLSGRTVCAPQAVMDDLGLFCT